MLHPHVAPDFRAGKAKTIGTGPRGIPDHAGRGDVWLPANSACTKVGFLDLPTKGLFATRFFSRRVSRVAIRFLVPRVEGALAYDPSAECASTLRLDEALSSVLVLQFYGSPVPSCKCLDKGWVGLAAENEG